MDAKKLVEFRKQAEKAVAEMPDGELKVKAFEVILGHLLASPAIAPARPAEEQARPKAKGREQAAQVKTIGGRILVLRDEGFFKNQKAIGQVREELRAHGWHYPLTTLSGTLQSLVRQRELRRERAMQGKKKIYKYSNP